MKFLKPTDINQMQDIYKTYPGPFAIDETDLEKIFPNIHSIKTKEYGEWVQGNLLEYNLSFINKLVSYLQPKIILEIGTYKGRTTYNMAKNTPDTTKIITIDPCLDVNYFSGSDARYLQKKSEIGTSFIGTEVENKIIQIYEDSTSMECQRQLDKVLNGEKIDFAFIDGGHTYENIKHDFEELILPRLNKRGVALFDDYNRLYTVIGAVHYLAEKAREDGYVFYWYAPRKSENTNEVLFLNLPESRNYNWREVH